MGLLASLYKFTSRTTGKIYIGSTTKTFPSDRKQGHLYCLRRNKHTNHHLQNVYNKHGEADLIFEVIGSAYFADQRQLREAEGRAIRRVPAHLRLNCHLFPDVNPMLGKTASPETREKLRQSHLGQKPSAETRAKLSAARVGREFSAETRAKIGHRHKGVKHTEEAKQKISEAKLGRPASNRKLTQDQADEIRQLRACGSTISDLSRQFGICRKSVRFILSGRCYNAGGFSE